MDDGWIFNSRHSSGGEIAVFKIVDELYDKNRPLELGIRQTRSKVG